MNTYKQHLDLANERFQTAEEQLTEDKPHTAAHLFINSAINYHNAICQKFLNKIPRHRPHSDTGYFLELSEFLKQDLPKYKTAYEFLIAYKSQADYGTDFSPNVAKQIYRKTKTVKEIAEHQL
ncbi:MAG: hypothetical protein NUV57_06025 [archaeon]|nr:hypothetical protein [archaeon]